MDLSLLGAPADCLQDHVELKFNRTVEAERFWTVTVDEERATIEP
tara:strand:- start:255 stop:389 length:135 start_codon:yes stop_codon:yes gene_type:complete